MTERDTQKLIATRRTDQAKKSRRLLKKTNKKLTLVEDRGYQAGFDEAVKRVHAKGWAYKEILGLFEDPITRPEEPDLPLEVSSGSESELSN